MLKLTFIKRNPLLKWNLLRHSMLLHWNILLKWLLKLIRKLLCGELVCWREFVVEALILYIIYVLPLSCIHF